MQECWQTPIYYKILASLPSHLLDIHYASMGTQPTPCEFTSRVLSGMQCWPHKWSNIILPWVLWEYLWSGCLQILWIILSFRFQKEFETWFKQHWKDVHCVCNFTECLNLFLWKPNFRILSTGSPRHFYLLCLVCECDQ